MHTFELPSDHPGFADAAYRARRDAIARHTRGTGVVYAPEEHALWARLARELAPLHARHACRAIVEASERVALDGERIPQLDEVTALVAPHTGFVLQPVPGLVPSRVFFEALARGVFLSTQYIRHASRPHYTPEPDVVHELVGHAASLADPVIARLNRRIGRAALGCDDDTLAALERLYWFTLEFGLVLEDGAPKALGAGLLSSVAEMERACRPLPGPSPKLQPLVIEDVIATPFRADAMQDVLFVADSFEALAATLEDVLGQLARPDDAQRVGADVADVEPSLDERGRIGGLLTAEDLRQGFGDR
jgi:phenylalanine-4-hydroxylase